MPAVRIADVLFFPSNSIDIYIYIPVVDIYICSGVYNIYSLQAVPGISCEWWTLKSFFPLSDGKHTYFVAGCMDAVFTKL